MDDNPKKGKDGQKIILGGGRRALVGRNCRTKGLPDDAIDPYSEGTQELDLTEVRTIEIKNDTTPLFELRHRPDRTAIEVRLLRAGARLAIRSLGSTGVELWPGDL